MRRPRGMSSVFVLVLLCTLSLLLPRRRAAAQDSCSGAQMSVSPCLAGEQHVSAGGTASFTVTNYAYAQDAYYIQPVCS